MLISTVEDVLLKMFLGISKTSLKYQSPPTLSIIPRVNATSITPRVMLIALLPGVILRAGDDFKNLQFNRGLVSFAAVFWDVTSQKWLRRRPTGAMTLIILSVEYLC